MQLSLKHAHRFFAYGGAHGFLAVMAFHIGDRKGWLIALPLMAAVSLYGWVSSLRRYRMIGDTPTSQIASAAQGYVELMGRAENYAERKVLARLSKRVCCWFRFRIEEQDHEGDWRSIDEGESDDSFVLRDDSGSCVIDPDGAEVTCAHEQSWTEGSTRYTEWCIEEGDPIYALGEFRTNSFAPGPEEARAAVDMLMKPADGRVFLLSNYPAEKFSRRLAWWAWGHLSLLFVALGALIFLFFQQPPLA